MSVREVMPVSVSLGERVGVPLSGNSVGGTAVARHVLRRRRVVAGLRRARCRFSIALPVVVTEVAVAVYGPFASLSFASL